MHMPSITANFLAVLTVACVALTLQMIRRRRSYEIQLRGTSLSDEILALAQLDQALGELHDLKLRLQRRRLD